MKHYEQNNNYMRDKKNFHREYLENREKTLKNEHEKIVARKSKYGKYASLIVVGENDRISGIEPQLLEDEEMKISYSYGFFEKGSRTLEGKFAKDVYTSEEQRNFGIIDLINNVPEEFLNNLKKYPSYMEGRLFQMGKNAYDYTNENNINIEEYLEIMSIIYPEVKTISFKEGYYAREKELNVKESR